MNRETPQKDRLCSTCFFFRQHYMKLGRRYVPLDYGHCAHPLSPARRSVSDTCTRWQAAPPETR